MKSPIERIIEKLGMLTLIDALSAQLSGADFASLLLEVMRRRAGAVRPAELMRRYASDRFVTPGAAAYRAVRRVEDSILAACPAHFEAIGAIVAGKSSNPKPPRNIC